MPAATEAERRELDRVGAFSDGVFAIAITLLVLNIEVPDVPGSDLGSAISDLSDDFVAYGIGLTVIFAGLTALVAIDGGLYAEPDPDRTRSRRRAVIVDTTGRALVFLLSIPIAYTISESLAKWFWLLLLVVSVADRRRGRRRGRAS